MKNIFILVAGLFLGTTAYAQVPDNTFKATINGKEWQAKAQRLKIPVSDFNYLAIAGMEVNPDVQLWIRLYYFGELKPGTYPVLTMRELESKYEKAQELPNGYALVDYTEETKKMGHGFHDGESVSGTVTVTSVTNNSIEGTFDAKMKGVYYQKRAVATMSGYGLMANLEKKVITAAGGGMLVTGDPHDHDNTKKTKETDEITVTDGKFRVNWGETSKAEASKKK
ncbi:hypothetical protein [Telluribacter sp. SYSU D00476]|uniref:hypothetical protein n=1 Tax=Telluribacter sp. SYSU D00476 TaxID=2811430 RepID=UPI001FF3D9FB|nr:hypothetical protein [Telluribacter sp. SYSU D00476]